MRPEKRQFPRIKIPLSVQYCYLDAEKNEIKWDTTAVRDLSEVGICITAMKCFSQGETLNFIFALPSNPLKKIEIKGKVVHSKPLVNAYGEELKGTFINHVQFYDLKEEEAAIIRSYITWVRERDA